MRWLALLLTLMAAPAAAHEYLLGDLQIIHPALPATPVGATTAPVYMVFANDGIEDERLLGIETPFGPVRFLRPVEGADGAVSMQELAWLDLPAGEIVALVRGPMEMRGRVTNLTHALSEGDELTGTMIFQKRGRFDMVFMVDPLELEEDPTTLPPVETGADRPGDIAAIATALRAELGDPQAMIAPVALAGDVAIAGWSREDGAARAFLRRGADGWAVELWSGPSLLLPASLTSLGVPPVVAEGLRAELTAQETALGPAFAARLDSFAGTVFVRKEVAP